ncbi:MAG: hypothetical protein H8E38_09770 [SAR324 cluster bacterium]|nr:hypothetical protein [SAR324 cluster bacterium]
MSPAQGTAQKALATYIQQPGPATTTYTAVATDFVELDFELEAGAALDFALTKSITKLGLTGAFCKISKAETTKLEYLIPALSPDVDHAAWYSEPCILEMPGLITDASIICGSHNQNPFYHCHGLFSDSLQSEATKSVGHLIPEKCLLSQPTHVTGVGFKNANFNRVYDPETQFNLFVPEELSPSTNNHQGLLLRIAPNIEITLPLIICCENLGWEKASVFGLGSLIGAHFEDERIMESFATEFYINKGLVDLSAKRPTCNLDVTIVGLDGKFMNGQLAENANPVLVTAEIILKRIC